MRRRYFTLDVFADQPLAGNPLAVVIDADGLDASRMQQIAREFNLSETVFVADPKDAVNTAAVRIFTPGQELPFAGHPTVGTAVLLAHLRARDLVKTEDVRIVLEEPIGDVVCVARHRRGEAMAAYFHLPKEPQRMGDAPDAAALAADLGVAPDEIGFDSHIPSVFGVGAPHIFAPLKTLSALASLDPLRKAWGASGGPSLYAYTRECVEKGSHFHARMFAGGWGIAEDPATGSAAAAFAGALMAFEKPGDGEHMFVIEQGLEMSRPSKISLGLVIEHGELVDATIGGYTRIVCEGILDV